MTPDDLPDEATPADRAKSKAVPRSAGRRDKGRHRRTQPRI